MLALAIHGGAGAVKDDDRAERLAGLELAIAAGRRVLETDGAAADAVTAAVRVLEDAPVFNAGTGSVLNIAGFVECDAGVMTGDTHDIGAVAAVVGVKNPVDVARALLHEREILFAKDDAVRFAMSRGMAPVDPHSLITRRRVEQWRSHGAKKEDGDTVGAVALDRSGTVAAATSTGGILRKPVGRIGDSPLPGCGYYADNVSGACSTTGWGESIARMALARRVLEHIEKGDSPQRAAEAAVRLLEARIVGGEGGLIVVSRDGRFGAAFNTPGMTYATWRHGEAAHYVP